MSDALNQHSDKCKQRYQRCSLHMLWTAHTNRILTPVWILHSCPFLSLISSSEASERLFCVPIMHCVLLRELTENVWLFTRSSVCYGTNRREANGPHSLLWFWMWFILSPEWNQSSHKASLQAHSVGRTRTRAEFGFCQAVHMQSDDVSAHLSSAGPAERQVNVPLSMKL